MKDRLNAYSVASAEFSAENFTGVFQLAADGETPRLVTVTRRGLLNAASPPRATAARFFEKLELFRAIAVARAIEASSGPICVTAEDIRRWRRSRPALSSTDSESG